MDKKLIQSASEKLKLVDVVLDQSKLQRNKDIEPRGMSANFSQQNRLDFCAEEIVFGDDGNELKLLRVSVNLGIRAIKSRDEEVEAQEKADGEDEAQEKADGEDEAISPLFLIEAVFRAEYLIEGELSDAEVQEFCHYNAVHNVWPFWRMHVFNTLKLASLPQLNIPLQRIDQIKK
ncbi:MAG: hypothetical protein RPU63_02605 [Candidatus Sedimenticola sp. (ex Thyasira tokunagai)]